MRNYHDNNLGSGQTAFRLPNPMTTNLFTKTVTQKVIIVMTNYFSAQSLLSKKVQQVRRNNITPCRETIGITMPHRQQAPVNDKFNPNPQNNQQNRFLQRPKGLPFPQHAMTQIQPQLIQALNSQL